MLDQDELERWEQALTERLLERAANDEEFRRQLVDDPNKALEGTDIGQEAQQLQEAILEANTPTAEENVSGYQGNRVAPCFFWSRYRIVENFRVDDERTR